jgi:hypothetical protein
MNKLFGWLSEVLSGAGGSSIGPDCPIVEGAADKNVAGCVIGATFITLCWTFLLRAPFCLKISNFSA